MDEHEERELENELKVTKEKLKFLENKLDSIMDLIYKTFNGDETAALELSNIVGVPPPLLHCDDMYAEKGKLNKQAHPSYRDKVNRFNNRLDFLNQVMNDHDRLMMGNRARPRSNTRVNSTLRRNRPKSADRIAKKVDRLLVNPYTWSLSDHPHVNLDSVFRHKSSDPIPASPPKPLYHKSLQTRPETCHNNSADLRVEDFLYSSNKRSVKSKTKAKSHAQANDFRLIPDNELSTSKPPKPAKATTSLNYTRSESGKGRLKQKSSTSYNALNLQPMTETDNKAEELLKAMEKRFELSTIDLQRRLGIPQAGMVGP